MFSLSKKVSSQVRAGVKRGFPVQKKMTQFLSSPFRTILHITCRWPGCNRWLSAQHPGDRAVKCHQIQTSKSLNSLHQIWMMAPCLFLEGVSLPWINESNRILFLFSHSCSSWSLFLLQSMTVLPATQSDTWLQSLLHPPRLRLCFISQAHWLWLWPTLPQTQACLTWCFIVSQFGANKLVSNAPPKQ